MNANFKHPDKKLNSGKELLENALIMAASSFFTALAGIKIVAVLTDPIATLTAAGIAAGLSFTSYLVTAKGLKARAAK